MNLVIDLETTCWEGVTDKDEKWKELEIIEIGAVLTDDTFNALTQFGQFVKPVKNMILTEFCTKLTSIKQSDVDEAKPFPQVMDAMKYWFNLQTLASSLGKMKETTFCSWGDFDRKLFVRDCKYHRVDYPFGKHRNIKHDFCDKFQLERIKLEDAIKMIGLKFDGRQHRGIDDARNIVRLCWKELI